MPHTSQITTWGTLFTEGFFLIYPENHSDICHTFLVIYQETFPKKLKAVHPKSCREGEKEKESNCRALFAKAQTQ